MKFLLLALYYSVCMVLIVVVLLQHGKGADIGVSLGAGSSNTVFGARGAGNFLTKLTTGCAILFMILAFSLARCAPEVSHRGPARRLRLRPKRPPPRRRPPPRSRPRARRSRPRRARRPRASRRSSRPQADRDPPHRPPRSPRPLSR